MAPDDGSVTLTIRLIRSFEFRNIRPVVYKNLSLNLTVDEMKAVVLEDIRNRTDLPPPVGNYDYDTLKIMHKAHGAKSNDPVINRENDSELILAKGTLRENGVEHETEISFFKADDYARYKSEAGKRL